MTARFETQFEGDASLRQMTAEKLKHLGEGKISYIRRMTGSEVVGMIPDAAGQIPDHAKVWALISADGQPIMISDNREMLEANASENNLATVSRH